MSWLYCIRPTAELPIPGLMLSFPSPPIGREEAASKECTAGFCKLLAAPSRGTHRGITPARTCQDRRKLFVPALVGREMLGLPYINRA